MKNLLHKETADEVLMRIGRVTADTKPLWGKMNAGQMMAHCQVPVRVSFGEAKLSGRFFGILLGPWIKRVILSDKPFKKGLPTHKSFLVTDERNFEIEQGRLKECVQRFYDYGKEKIGKFPHPFFGKMTPDEWGTSMYKHLDHHLKQFGV
ncbi:MAG TPA: DUF1569 domain-containing protein [Chitinophagaceae bacterium]|nr:DUF1569 domain-containing protein [Chitinophagaceae bacterium]